MAANVAAMLLACEQVALGVIGSGETVPAGTFELGAYQPAPSPVDAFVQSRVEVEIQPSKDTGTVPRSSNAAVLSYDVLVRCAFTTEFELDDAGRRASRAVATQGTDLVRAALTEPQQLRATLDGTLTGIISGCLIKATSKIVREDHKARIYVTEITATALVQTSRP